MDENNQILDVTYGKFSCRLEGFEDSVETMKLVVSYFHELAGHDRFMDTEPLAPDMETLAALTEGQTGQQVEIEDEGNKVSLRVQAREPDAGFDAEESDAEPSIPDDQYVEDSVDEAAIGDDTDDMSSVAERLQRMRAAAERKVAEATDAVGADLSEPAKPASVNPLSQRLSELVKRTSEADAETVEEEETADEMQAAENDADTPDGDMPDGDMTEVAQEESPEDTDALDADDLNVFSDFAPEAEAQDAPTAETHNFMSQFIELHAHNYTDEGKVAAETAEPVADDEDAIEDDAELDAFMADEDDQDEMIAAEDVVTAEETYDVQPTVSEDEAVETTETTDDQPLVLTSKDKAEEDHDEHDDYNDDDEFDLEKEVAKVEAEIAARKGNEFARRGLPRHVEDAMSRIMSQTDQHLNQPENRRHRDAFAQLKAAVAATEAARQLGDTGAGKPDPDDVYKDDLGAYDANAKEEGKSVPPLKLVKSQEVKPAPGPLEQSIPAPSAPAPSAPEHSDSDQTEPASARLRQIATQKEAESTAENRGFAEFVASHGATELSDQLEAAGAYICFVEGEADFSRPQVMKVVQSASNAEISREDGLRSFGRLLRQARLVKLANGRFQVADNTQYRPNGNKAARG